MNKQEASKFTFKTIEHVDVTPSELEEKIDFEHFRDKNCKWFFFFDGNPYDLANCRNKSGGGASKHRMAELLYAIKEAVDLLL